MCDNFTKRLCDKSKQLAMEKKKTHLTKQENDDLRIQIMNLSMQVSKLQDIIQNTQNDAKINEYAEIVKENKELKHKLQLSINEIIYLKSELHDISSKSKQLFEEMSHSSSLYVSDLDFCSYEGECDSLGAPDSPRSDEPTIASLDIQMLDSAYDESGDSQE